MRQISRRQLAIYAAKALVAGKTNVVEQLAAYLAETNRTKEASLLARDIEKALETKGVVVARVKTAHGLQAEQQAEIEQLIKKRYGAKQVVLSTSEHGDLLGGVVVSTAGDEFDGSLRRNINRLKVVKV